jgi:hypothetical protein
VRSQHLIGLVAAVIAIAPGDRASALDPAAFFADLVDRYRDLQAYDDRIELTQTSVVDGQPLHTVRSQVQCRLRGASLTVQTPRRQVASLLGLPAALRHATAAWSGARRYDLWLAPHMGLHFARDPLREFRAGVAEGFVVDDATPGDGPHVHLVLRSDGPPRASARATFDLTVNRQTMLIERIESREQLPGGGELRTTLQIDVLEADPPRSPAVEGVGASPARAESAAAAPAEARPAAPRLPAAPAACPGTPEASPLPPRPSAPRGRS